jgi:DTW domain-containing protein YfiP
MSDLYYWQYTEVAIVNVVSIDDAKNVAVRLREARTAMGLSTRAVAALLSQKLGGSVSHNTIDQP